MNSCSCINVPDGVFQNIHALRGKLRFDLKAMEVVESETVACKNVNLKRESMKQVLNTIVM